MTKWICFFISLLLTGSAWSQEKNDPWLIQLLQDKGSAQLKTILQHPKIYRYQLIYTRIDRNKKNQPHFTHQYYRVNKDEYFNPASMVKLPTALLALEKLHRYEKYGVDKFSTMLTDSAYERQTAVRQDTSSATGLPSVAHYVKKIFLVSDNDAYNRLYEFVGQEMLNKRLWDMGYKDIRITRRFVTMNEDQNRHTNPVRFFQGGKILYEQPAACNPLTFNYSRQVLIGQAHYNREDSLINAPMDFTTHNNFPLENMQQILQSALFPGSVPARQRFHLRPGDYQYLYKVMSEWPSESRFPSYDTAEYFDSYTKFFLFKAGRTKPPDHIRVFNKTGWSYGFLTDVAYIVDFKHNIEFMLSGVIYVNSDGILNDNKYEYESIGYPFFKEIGNIIYDYELTRVREFSPDLSRFKYVYE